MSENILDIIKASQLPQVSNPDPSVYRLLISNNDNLRTAPLYFITEKIQEALDAANGAFLFGGSLVPDIEEANEKALLAYNWANETRDMTFDGDGYFDTLRLKSASIEAKHLMIGTRSQQFSLPNVKFAFSSDFLTLNYSAGKISHLTIDPDGITEWTISAGSISLTSAYHYIFVKAVKGGTTATIIGSTTPIKVEDVPGFYHFEVGYASSIADGIRLFKTNYGFAQINPSEISIGRIADPTGVNYIQLGQNGIDIVAGSVTFRSPSTGGYKDLGEEYDDINDNLDSLNLVRDYVNNLLPQELQGLQDQIDGVVDDWYYPHSPTSGNLPASDWTTLQLKKDHEGDRFTNTQPFVDEITTPDSGKQWRWLETSTNVFEWVLIPNSESAIALTRANEAFDLADGKRRIFVAQPVTPYDIGDLWTQGSGGEIMRCKTARTSGSFVAADWERASKYTDDSTALLIEATLNTSIANSLQAAKDYSDAELDAREITIKAYADGQVTAAENRSILDATNKANAAKAYADAQDLLLKTQMEVYADGKVSDEEAARLAQASANLAAAKSYADAQANAAQVASNAYADGIVSDEEARAIADADDKLTQAKQYADALQTATEAAMMIYADGKVSDLEAEMLTNIDNSLVAAKSYADAQDSLSLITAKAYTDGEVSAEEARAIADATAKAEAAKLYAEAQDLLLKAQMEAYADGVVSAEEAQRIQAIKNAADAAKEYTDNQAILSKIASEAYADGIVDEAERLAIEEAQKAAELARLKTIELLGGMTVGATNLLREYDIRFNFKYWGGNGTSEEVNLDAITVIDGFSLGGFLVNDFEFIDENGKKLELIL